MSARKLGKVMAAACSMRLHGGNDEIRPGAIRWIGRDGVHHVTTPRDPLYSTALMVAVEYWDGERWMPMHDEERP